MNEKDNVMTDEELRKTDSLDDLECPVLDCMKHGDEGEDEDGNPSDLTNDFDPDKAAEEAKEWAEGLKDR